MSTLPLVRDVAGGAVLQVRLHPGAKQDAVAGKHDSSIKISLKAPAVDGRANAALIEFIAERLRIPRARVYLLAGSASRNVIRRFALRAEPQRRSKHCSSAQ